MNSSFRPRRFQKSVFLGGARNKAIGYLRLNDYDSSAEEQVNLLRRYGCKDVFYDILPARIKELHRPNLEKSISSLDKGGYLVVLDLSHLGTSQLSLMSLFYQLQNEGKFIRSLDGLVNTKELEDIPNSLFGLLLSLQQLESSYLRKAAKENLEYRRKTGANMGGRPKTHKEKESLVLRLRSEGTSYRSIRNQTGLALSTIRRIIVDN